MYILGAGAAVPGVVITDNDLASLGIDLPSLHYSLLKRFDIKARRTSLPLEFIRADVNFDVLAAQQAASESPTSLGVRAAREAMGRAGVSADQLGLIIADCATPNQTCPSEAQRIGGALGLKVPSYDVTLGMGALPAALDILSSWKEERVPDYVLFVSTNTPTQRVQYGSDPLSAYVLGDAASAFVLSARHRGKIEVKGSYLAKERGLPSPFTVQRTAALAADRVMSCDLLRDRVSAGLLSLGATKTAYIVGPQLLCGDVGEIATSLGFSAERVVKVTQESGYSLGASTGCALSSVWDKIQVNDQVAMLHEGDGVSAGILLRVAQ